MIGTLQRTAAPDAIRSKVSIIICRMDSEINERLHHDHREEHRSLPRSVCGDCIRRRNSRIKTKRWRSLRPIFALSSIGGIFIRNGPLGDVKGLFTFFVPMKHLDKLKHILPRIGYCDRFYLLDFHSDQSENHTELVTINELIWEGRRFSLHKYHEQNATLYEKQSPHKRKFKILDENNEVKVVHGYRGDGSETGRRALPAEDARCMVNLSNPYRATKLLDPFSGGGGIVLQAKYIKSSLKVYSVDIDPVVSPGLQVIWSRSTMSEMQARFNSLERSSIPSSLKSPLPNSTETILEAIDNLNPYLKEDGNIIMMSSADQAEKINHHLHNIGMHGYVYHPIDRKGIDVVIMAWTKSDEKIERMQGFLDVVERVY